LWATQTPPYTNRGLAPPNNRLNFAVTTKRPPNFEPGGGKEQWDSMRRVDKRTKEGMAEKKVWWRRGGMQNRACNGGEDSRSYRWLLQNTGGAISTEASYGPYLNAAGWCHWEKATPGARINGYAALLSFHLPQSAQPRFSEPAERATTVTGAHSFIRTGKKCTLALISWVWRDTVFEGGSRGEAWRG